MAVKKDKKPKSRRDKFHEWITSEGLSLIGGWARDGLTDEQIAKNMGITRATLYEWRKRFPDISDALTTNKEVADRQVENALYKKANGYEYEEHKTYISTDSSGKEIKKVEVFKRYAQPDTASIIYWLNNRMPKKWKNQPRFDSDTSGDSKFDDLLKEALLTRLIDGTEHKK